MQARSRSPNCPAHASQSGELLERIKQVATMAPLFLEVLEQALQQHSREMDERAKILAKTGRLPKRAPLSRGDAQGNSTSAVMANAQANAIATADAEKSSTPLVATTANLDVQDPEDSVEAECAAEANRCSGLLGDQDDDEEAIVLCSNFDQGSSNAQAADAPIAMGSTLSTGDGQKHQSRQQKKKKRRLSQS